MRNHKNLKIGRHIIMPHMCKSFGQDGMFIGAIGANHIIHWLQWINGIIGANDGAVEWRQ